MSYLFRDKRRFQLKIANIFPPPCILRPGWKSFPWNWVPVPGVRKLKWWGYRTRKKFGDIFSCVDTILQRDRRTDGRTDRRTDGQTDGHRRTAKTTTRTTTIRTHKQPWNENRTFNFGTNTPVSGFASVFSRKSSKPFPHGPPTNYHRWRSYPSVDVASY